MSEEKPHTSTDYEQQSSSVCAHKQLTPSEWFPEYLGGVEISRSIGRGSFLSGEASITTTSAEGGGWRSWGSLGGSHPLHETSWGSKDLSLEETSKPISLKSERLENLLKRNSVDMRELGNCLWSGVPDDADSCVRMFCWQIMLGYLPCFKERRRIALLKKREEYAELRTRHYNMVHLSEDQQKCLRQIRLDLPRMGSDIRMLMHTKVQGMMERILYIFAVRHPASGYVQGMNELLTPFFFAFMKPHFPNEDLDSIDFDVISDDIFDIIEADSYWCLSKILTEILDNYTFGQPGIQRMIQKLRDIIQKMDEPLDRHLEAQEVEYLQVSFKWMSCFFVREFPMDCVMRLWDAYIGENGDGFSKFHVFVCAVFLLRWSQRLRQLDFQQILLFLQSNNTSKWTLQDVDSLLGEAYIVQNAFTSKLQQ